MPQGFTAKPTGSCPNCMTGGAWARYCKKCGQYFCPNCVRKEVGASKDISNVCPLCGSHGGIGPGP